MTVYNPSPSGGGSSSIPELSSDPVAPTQESAWVLKSSTGGTRRFNTSLLPLGLVLANSGGSTSYQLSYFTKESSIKRITLT
jgi:hypothetical protein